MLVDPRDDSNEILTSDFAAAAWPEVSFDGRRLLFVGRRDPDDADAVFELDLAERRVREVALSLGEIHRAIYLPALYTLDVEEPFEQFAVLARPPGETVDAIFTCKRDGSRVTRVTFAPTGVRSPSMLRDGRLLFEMGEPARWFTIHTDGTDVFPFADAIPPAAGDNAWAELIPRPRPAGRSSSVEAKSAWGRLYCLDVRISDDPDRALESAAVVRVSTPTAAGSVVLGQGQVEADGSFFLEAPARTPLRLELLDEDGGIVRAMKSWIWIMPGEDRGCIGCHEDRALTPPNRHVTALRRPPQRIGPSSNLSEGR